MVTIRQSVNGVDKARIETAVNYYLTQGFTPLGAAYLVGNMIQESSLLPNNPGTDQGAVGTPGASEGLIQWTWERKNGLPSDFQGQLAFVIPEMLRHGDSALLAALKNPATTRAQLQGRGEGTFYRWIGWGDEGNRFGFGDQILADITGQPLPPVNPSALPGDIASTPSAMAGIQGSIAGIKSALFSGENCPPPGYTQKERIIYTGCQSKIQSAIQASLGAGYPAPGIGAPGKAEPGIGNSPYSGQLKPGGYITPVRPGYVITSRYGPRSSPCAGCSTFHKGIDLSTPEGTPVYAAADGKVGACSFDSCAGNLVAIDHVGGFSTNYFHLSVIGVQCGQEIKQGTKVGLSGTTGSCTTGPHLHFECVSPTEGKIDPERLITF